MLLPCAPFMPFSFARSAVDFSSALPRQLRICIETTYSGEQRGRDLRRQSRLQIDKSGQLASGAQRTARGPFAQLVSEHQPTRLQTHRSGSRPKPPLLPLLMNAASSVHSCLFKRRFTDSQLGQLQREIELPPKRPRGRDRRAGNAVGLIKQSSTSRSPNTEYWRQTYLP